MFPTKQLVLDESFPINLDVYSSTKIKPVNSSYDFYTLQNYSPKNFTMAPISNSISISNDNENNNYLRNTQYLDNYCRSPNTYYQTIKSIPERIDFQENNILKNPLGEKKFFKNQLTNLNLGAISKITNLNFMNNADSNKIGVQYISPNIYLKKKDSFLNHRKNSSIIFDEMAEMIPNENHANSNRVFETKKNPFSLLNTKDKTKNIYNLNNLNISQNVEGINRINQKTRNTFLKTKFENIKTSPTEINSKKEKNNNSIFNKIKQDIKNEDQNCSHQIIITPVNDPLNKTELFPVKFIPKEFKMVMQIGQGVFGELFSVLWKKNNKLYALKIQPVVNKKQINRIKNEMELLKDFYNKTKCDGIIRIYDDLWETESNGLMFHHTLMEIADTDWEQEIIMRIRYQEFYTEKELINILGQIITTCALLQKNKISHRDIKPQNILIKKGKYKLSDFGEAKLLKKNGLIVQKVRGTELYMSPKCFYTLRYGNRPNPQVKHNTYKSDVYSLGMSAYFAATLDLACLGYIREIKDMSKVDIIVRDCLSVRYSQNFISFILEMLEINENMRPDFIKLEQQMTKKE